MDKELNCEMEFMFELLFLGCGCEVETVCGFEQAITRS